MKVFYFTATGNSLKIAKELSTDLYSIPKLLRTGNYKFEDDVIGFVFPCYVGSIPTVVEEFLTRGQFKAKYIFGIMTYGKRSMGGLKQFTGIAKSNGVHVDYVNEVLMVDTSLKYYDMEKQVLGLPGKKVDLQLECVKKDISDLVKNTPKLKVFMNQASKVGHVLYRKEIGDCDKLFAVESHCNGCRVCEKVCPIDNIRYESGVLFDHKCIRCYACTQNCPSNAIRFKGEKSSSRFRNKDVSLKEIIESNT